MQEHAGHLADLDESLFLGRLDDYAGGVPVLRAADMSNALTESAQHGSRPLSEVLARCLFLRRRVVGRLEELPRSAFAKIAQHPRLGVPMRLVDLMLFQAEHDDYHLAKITELRRSLEMSR